MNQRAKADPKLYPETEMMHHQIRLVNGLTFTYENLSNKSSIKTNVKDELKTPEQIYGSTLSPFQEVHEQKHVLIMVTGEPGAGKNTSFKELASRFSWLEKSFKQLDIDFLVEQKTEEYKDTHNGNSPDEAYQQKIYDSCWPSFVKTRDELIRNKENIVLFLTGRHENLIPEYRDLTEHSYRIVIYNISVSNPEELATRAKVRESKTGRAVHPKFAKKCAETIPPALFAHTYLHQVPRVNIRNDTGEPLFFCSMTSYSPEWLKVIEEPTFRPGVYLTPDSQKRLGNELFTLTFGFRKFMPQKCLTCQSPIPCL